MLRLPRWRILNFNERVTVSESERGGTSTEYAHGLLIQGDNTIDALCSNGTWGNFWRLGDRKKAKELIVRGRGIKSVEKW